MFQLDDLLGNGRGLFEPQKSQRTANPRRLSVRNRRSDVSADRSGLLFVLGPAPDRHNGRALFGAGRERRDESFYRLGAARVSTGGTGGSESTRSNLRELFLQFERARVRWLRKALLAAFGHVFETEHPIRSAAQSLRSMPMLKSRSGLGASECA